MLRPVITVTNTLSRPNRVSRFGSSNKAPEDLFVELLIDLRCKGGVKVTEAANEVTPWTGVPGGALSLQGEAEADLHLLNLKREALEHAVEAILSHHEAIEASYPINKNRLP